MDGMRWPEGFEAWQRLRGWHERSSADGAAALEALSDIGVVRRLLDQTELAAVRAARGNAKSWAEIATRLGVTRQSAWERWRDLDDEPRGEDVRGDVVSGRLVDEIKADAARELTTSRRGALVVVPDVTGLEWETAHRVLRAARLVAVSADPDGPPIPVLQSNGSVVVEQKPAPGERREPGSPVTLWFGRGPGSAGVREPLRPRPSPRSTGGAVDEQTGESVP
ncbi:MAG TPA: PASTA domain-containing protein [Pseudonocardia sp.]